MCLNVPFYAAFGPLYFCTRNKKQKVWNIKKQVMTRCRNGLDKWLNNQIEEEGKTSQNLSTQSIQLIIKSAQQR